MYDRFIYEFIVDVKELLHEISELKETVTKQDQTIKVCALFNGWHISDILASTGIRDPTTIGSYLIFYNLPLSDISSLQILSDTNIHQHVLKIYKNLHSTPI